MTGVGVGYRVRMRVVVTGASGNVGSAVVSALSRHPDVESIVGVCRRPHDWVVPRTTWHWADVAEDDLHPVLTGADVLVHLAWLFQPTRDPATTWHANAQGSARVLQAAVGAGVGAVVVASSVGAYSARADLDPVGETWPTQGVAQAAYSREKAYVERLLDLLESVHDDLRVVRMRPAFTFQESSAVQQRRLFLGPLVPHLTVQGRLPVLPLPADLRFQALHSDDAAAAYVAAVTLPVSGTFNLAADPVLAPADLAEQLGARWVDTSAGVLRGALGAAHASRAVPASPGLFDLLMNVPVMRTDRARDVLGWRPVHSGPQAVQAFLDGLQKPVDGPTPPLAAETSGVLRWREWATGVGARAG